MSLQQDPAVHSLETASPLSLHQMRLLAIAPSGWAMTTMVMNVTFGLATRRMQESKSPVVLGDQPRRNGHPQLTCPL